MQLSNTSVYIERDIIARIYLFIRYNAQFKHAPILWITSNIISHVNILYDKDNKERWFFIMLFSDKD